MAKREFTKKQLFDWEMIYKSKIPSTETSFTNINTLTFKALDVITENLDRVFYGNRTVILKFLSDYKNVINWQRVFGVSYWNTTVNNNLTTIVNKYNKYFDKKCWDCLSKHPYFCRNEKLIRKYKDKINWDSISECHDFSPEFYLEMKDYINLKILKTKVFNRNSTFRIRSKLGDQILKYFFDHEEEVLTYDPSSKSEEIVNHEKEVI